MLSPVSILSHDEFERLWCGDEISLALLQVRYMSLEGRILHVVFLRQVFILHATVFYAWVVLLLGRGNNCS